MFARLRQFRFLAVLLLVGSPGTGGMVLQAVHSCMAGIPQVAEAAAGAHHAGHHDDAPAEPACQCIGPCQAALAVAAPRTDLAVRIELPPSSPLPIAAATRVPPEGRVVRLLPPATAPPLI